MTEKKTKIIFSLLERTKVDFKLALQYDKLTQVHFLRGVIDAYLQKEPSFMAFLETYKKKTGIQSNQVRKRIAKNIKESEATKRIFALDDDEIENIFDILEKEHPDL